MAFPRDWLPRGRSIRRKASSGCESRANRDRGTSLVQTAAAIGSERCPSIESALAFHAGKEPSERMVLRFPLPDRREVSKRSKPPRIRSSFQNLVPLLDRHPKALGRAPRGSPEEQPLKLIDPPVVMKAPCGNKPPPSTAGIREDPWRFRTPSRQHLAIHQVSSQSSGRGVGNRPFLSGFTGTSLL